MESQITAYYEGYSIYIGGIEHVESKNIQGLSVTKLFFHPGTNMGQAMAEAVGYVNRAHANMPPGALPPYILRFDTGSVPIGYLWPLIARATGLFGTTRPCPTARPADLRQPCPACRRRRPPAATPAPS